MVAGETTTVIPIALACIIVWDGPAGTAAFCPTRGLMLDMPLACVTATTGCAVWVDTDFVDGFIDIGNDIFTIDLMFEEGSVAADDDACRSAWISTN